MKKQMDQQIQQFSEVLNLEERAKLDRLKKLLESEKSELARLKSVKNIRLTKLEEERKKIKSQMLDQKTKYESILFNIKN